MPIPLVKAGITFFRYTLRPVNNVLIRHFKAYPHSSAQYQFFAQFGQATHRFEVRLNRWMLGTKGLGEIDPLHESVAFNKGVDWFTEIFLFYGVLAAITWWELSKASKQGQKTKAQIQVIGKDQGSLRENIAETSEAIAQVSSLQTVVEQDLAILERELRLGREALGKV